jgi:hypothetical protein
VEKEDTSGGTMLVQSRPPDWCTAAVLDRGTWPGIRPLVGIAEFPVFLPDGSILSTPGYDASSGLYYLPAVPVEVTVPDAPTAADADAALRTLSESVCDFPFVSDHHRSAWLAGLLTPLARFAFTGPSPLFLVEANVPGAGKGLLVSTANLIVRGDSSAVLEFSRDAEELQKVLTALLIQGESIAMFDNVEGTLGGGVLNKLLTAELWEGRILGTSSTVRVPNLCTWWCTGNNVSVLGDTARRVCAIRLESPLENPEERTDLHHDDLPAWVRSSRPRAAVGRPDGAPGLPRGRPAHPGHAGVGQLHALVEPGPRGDRVGRLARPLGRRWGGPPGGRSDPRGHAGAPGAVDGHRPGPRGAHQRPGDREGGGVRLPRDRGAQGGGPDPRPEVEQEPRGHARLPLPGVFPPVHRPVPARQETGPPRADLLVRVRSQIWPVRG